jgi:chemotaxis protein CheC
MVMSLSKPDLKHLKKIKNIKDLDKFSLSVISEIGNILAGHYASALANLMGRSLIPTVPDIALDSLRTILNSLVAKYSEQINHLVVIKTDLMIEDLNIKGNFCFIPDIGTLEQLFKAINVDPKFSITED